MLSLREVERAAAILDRLLRGHRLQRVVQPDAHSLVLEWYGREGDTRSRHEVLLCCHPELARISLVEGARNPPGGPPRFAQYLRAHIGRARLEGCRLLDGERQLALRLRAQEGDFDLLLAIFGHRSNVLLLDAETRIVASLQPLSRTRSELTLGELWQSPGSVAPSAGEDRFAASEGADFLRAIESHYEKRQAEATESTITRRIETALRKERKLLARKLEKLEGELASAERDSMLERQGELLKTALSSISKGDAEAVVEDWETGEALRIPIDPQLTPAENLERLFKRYRKAIRTLTRGGAQREAVRGVLAELEALEVSFEVARSRGTEALETLASEAGLARLLAKFAPAPAVKARSGRAESREVELAGRRIPARLVPRRYCTESGLEVWVGRSDAANDFLSTRLARGKDLFFHLEGAPGSHVILRTEGRSDPPSEAVLDACELAVHFSKQKKANRADVHVVPIQNVRKPKGAKPGLVVVHGGRSVHLRREEKRLERILAARIET